MKSAKRALNARMWSWLAVIAALVAASTAAAEPALLNVSYDVTREFYREFNQLFAAQWKAEKGKTITINQSHGGSSKQARAVLDGLEADVVTMNQATDLDVLAKAGLIAPDWVKKFPHSASPYTSTIVFVVRKGNPKVIKGWDDLIKPGLQVIIPNPKTSGNGRYSYLAAWIHALKSPGGNEAKARAFVSDLFRNVPVLDAGGRGATTTFAQRGIGDVLLTFENEAWLSVRELEQEGLEVVIPAESILAEAPVAVVEKWADKHGTRAIAEAYLQALYSPEGQAIAVKHRLRPRSPELLAKHADVFPPLKLYSVDDEFGGWAKAQATHFADRGIFDQIYIK